MLNKVTLIGNVGAAPECRELKNGTATARLSLATTDKWTDNSSGERRERTEWHTVVFYEGLAKVVRDHVKIGGQLYIEGELRKRKYTDRDGIDRWTTDVIGREMRMLGKRSDTSGKPPADEAPMPSEDDYRFV